jgi:hypothetical protein
MLNGYMKTNVKINNMLISSKYKTSHFYLAEFIIPNNEFQSHLFYNKKFRFIFSITSLKTSFALS